MEIGHFGVQLAPVNKVCFVCKLRSPVVAPPSNGPLPRNEVAEGNMATYFPAWCMNCHANNANKEGNIIQKVSKARIIIFKLSVLIDLPVL